MPTFQDQPAWRVSLANLTQWFDWDAIGAIGTVGAFAIAIYLARSDARKSAERDEVYLRAATLLLQTVISMAKDFVWKSEQGVDCTAEATTALAFCERHHFFERIRDYNPAGLPDAESMNDFMSAQIAAQGVKDFLTARAQGKDLQASHLEPNITQLEKYQAALLKAADARGTSIFRRPRA